MPNCFWQLKKTNSKTKSSEFALVLKLILSFLPVSRFVFKSIPAAVATNPRGESYQLIVNLDFSEFSQFQESTQLVDFLARVN